MARERQTLTLPEAASLLGLSSGTLRVQANAGRLRAVKRGRDWWVTRREIERYRADQLGYVGRRVGAKDRVPRKRRDPAA
jgi:excisionase family DNA binding protein